MSWPRLFRFALLPVLLVGACARAPYQYTPPPAAAAASSGTTAAQPQLLFLSFRVLAPAQGAHRIELVQATAVAGQLTQLPAEDVGPSYLQLTLLDDKGQPCAPPLRVAHPLLQQLEYPAEGNAGRLETKLVTLPEAEFFVRLARPARARAVRVEEAGPAAPTPTSVTFPLSL